MVEENIRMMKQRVTESGMFEVVIKTKVCVITSHRHKQDQNNPMILLLSEKLHLNGFINST